jgi:hypothetical protein
VKINNIISEDRSYLYEGLTLTESKSVKLWETAGRKLYEFALTPEQIQQLFQQIEQTSTAAGDNRTAIGKGKDVADAVNKAWTDLKSKVQNSGPISNIDQKYDQAAAKLKQATGGDTGVMKYVQKYRDFAKKHPIAQSLIYAALIAAAGISGAGVGGAAALGLLKMTDKLLQGEKFSSAAYAGAKTGALAYGAGQVGKALQGGEKVTSTTTTDTGVVNMPGDPALNQAMDAGQAAQQTASGLGRTTLSTFQNDPYYGKQLATVIGDKQYNPAWMQEFTKQLGRQVANPGDPSSMSQAWINASRAANSVAGNPTGALKESRYIDRKLTVYTWALNESRGRPLGGVQLTNEGVGDMFKKAAGAVGNWAQTKGKNLTTRVTADKLQSAWKKAGSPMDSEEVAKVLKGAGIPDDMVKQMYTDMKIPLPGSPKEVPPVNTSTGAPQATPPADPAVTGPAPKPTPKPAPAPVATPATANANGAQPGATTPPSTNPAQNTQPGQTQPGVADPNPSMWDKVKSFIPGTQARSDKLTSQADAKPWIDKWNRAVRANPAINTPEQLQQFATKLATKKDGTQLLQVPLPKDVTPGEVTKYITNIVDRVAAGVETDGTQSQQAQQAQPQAQQAQQAAQTAQAAQDPVATPAAAKEPNYDEVTGAMTPAGQAKKDADDAQHAELMKTNPKYAELMKKYADEPDVTPPPTKTHTGGKVKGQVSQTPNAIRQRQARAAKAGTTPSTTPTTGGAGAFGQMAAQLGGTQPNTMANAPVSKVNVASPTNPNQPQATPATTAPAAPAAPATTTPAKVRPTYGQAPAKVTGAARAGAPTPEEQAVLQQKIAAAQAAGKPPVQESVDLAEVLWRKMKRSQ